MTTFSGDERDLGSVAQFAEAATNAIHAQRGDIDHLSGCVGRLDNDVHFLKNFMTGMQRNISKRTSAETSGQSTFIPVSAVNHHGLSLESDEVEAIIGSIARLNTKAAEFEGLRIEMDFLKTRLRRLEAKGRQATRRISAASPLTNAGHNNHTVTEPQQASSLITGRSSNLNPEKEKFTKGEDTMRTKRAFSSTAPHMFGTWKKVQYSESPTATVEPTPIRTSLPDLPLASRNQQRDLRNDSSDQEQCHPCTDEYNSTINTASVTMFQPVQTPYLESTDCGPVYSRKSHEQEQHEVDNCRNHSSPTVASETMQFNILQSSPTTDELINDRRSRGTTKTAKSRRRRGEGLRDKNGVRVRKNGKPDGRAGNYKYLQAYYENKKTQREKGEKEEDHTAQLDEKGNSEEPELEVVGKQTGDESGVQLSQEALERIASAAQARVRMQSGALGCF